MHDCGLLGNIYAGTNFAREFQTTRPVHDVVSITRKSRSDGVMREAPITRRLRNTERVGTARSVLEHAQLAEDIIHDETHSSCSKVLAGTLQECAIAGKQTENSQVLLDVAVREKFLTLLT